MKEKKLYSIKEALEIIPCSPAGLWKACKEGKIPSVRVAGRIFVPSWFINELVNKPVESEVK